ncbi:MAG: DUF4189 domain-containing protein [Sphingopyxis sp.]|uniref:DUF4189 domain-containing protein n=1 Tax=Sphingopyxis sp. TaxID=1908224 RepID=UPI0032EED3B9
MTVHALFTRLWKSCPALLLLALGWCFWPAPATAQHVCSGRSDEVMVGVGRGGPGVAGPPLCRWVTQSDQAPVSGDDYSAIAWHPDANDVWASALHNSPGGAVLDAKSACTAVMGEGCESTWQVNGYIVVSRTNYGDVMWLKHDKKSAARREMAKWCEEKNLRCTEIGMFKSSDRYRGYNPQAVTNLRRPEDIANIRRSYAAAYLDMRENSTADGFIATGYASLDEAKAAALQACRNAEPGDDECEFVNSSGSRVMILYSDVTGQTYLRTDFSLADAAEGMKLYCERKPAEGCRVERTYDVSVRGMHRFPYRVQR